MARCFVGLGANQGNPSETFERARQSLNLLPGISLRSASSSYLTQAMGFGSDGDFHNAVVELQATISPLELLEELQSIETILGRQRGVRWGPRIIDLDLLYYDDLSLVSETLMLPHPHAWYRRFVLEPMCEIASEFPHPVYSLTQEQLLQRIDRRPFKLEILGEALLPREIERLPLEFPGLEIEYVSSVAPEGRGALFVGRNEEPDAIVPVLNLDQLPVETEYDVLRNVLASCLGHCTRID